jgi:hypothetical protein
MPARRVPDRSYSVSDATPHLSASERNRGRDCPECRGTGIVEYQSGASWADFVVEPCRWCQPCPRCGYPRSMHDDGCCPPDLYPSRYPVLLPAA